MKTENDKGDKCAATDLQESHPGAFVRRLPYEAIDSRNICYYVNG